VALVTKAPEPFCGPRLRLARSFNGLTRADLAREASVTPQYIGHFEHGHRQPTPVLLDAFATVLGFEESCLFCEPLAEFRDEECHFRRRTTTPVSVRTRVLAHGSLFGTLVTFLDASVKMPPENIPTIPFTSPEAIEEAAQACRVEWKLGTDVPIKNLVRAVECAGVVVTRFGAETLKVDAFSRAGKRSVVVLNADKDCYSRSRFDLAHECAHLIGHGGLTTGDPETEKQADRFAGALLLPRAGFLREFPRSRTLDWPALFALKRRWGVSLSAIVRRAYELRLLPATLYQAAYKHMAYRGWLRHEPEEPAPEEPELLGICFQQVAKDQGLRGTDIAAILGWPSSTLARVAGISVAEPESGPPHPGTVVSLAAARMKRAL
jgi:Zn-dependent peptidase ImmA (M78 family)/transcriptional regulator with XRE-family HTH domain